MESQGTLTNQKYLEKIKLESSTILDFKTYYKDTVIKQCGTGIRTDIYSIGLTDQNRDLRNKPSPKWSIDF